MSKGKDEGIGGNLPVKTNLVRLPYGYDKVIGGRDGASA